MPLFVTRDGCALHHRVVEPSGPPTGTVVLLHGWSQSSAMFDRLLPLLDPTLRIITFDMRNHGRSGRTDRGARIAALAADLVELLDHLQVDRAHLVGHSMGASVLWSHIDLAGTGRLSSLTVIDQPSAVVVLPWMSAQEAPEVGAILDFAGLEGFCAGVMGPDHAEVRRAFLTSMLTQDIPADDVEWLYQQNLLLPMPWGSRLLLDHAQQDWRDVLPHIDVPTLVIGGEVSHVDASSQAWTASRIPEARLVVFRRDHGGAHFPFYESPADFAAVLHDFLASAGEHTGAMP